MGSIMGRLFARRGAEKDDDILGCDMVPPPAALATLLDPQADEGAPRSAAPGVLGPFTTCAQAPIRDG